MYLCNTLYDAPEHNLFSIHVAEHHHALSAVSVHHISSSKSLWGLSSHASLGVSSDLITCPHHNKSHCSYYESCTCMSPTHPLHHVVSSRTLCCRPMCATCLLWVLALPTEGIVPISLTSLSSIPITITPITTVDVLNAYCIDTVPKVPQLDLSLKK